MTEEPLRDSIILVTGGARRVGRLLALACAKAGADVIVHHGHSESDAVRTKAEIESLGRRAWVLAADLSQNGQAAELVGRAAQFGELHGLVNSAAIFEAMSFEQTTVADWQRHLDINLTAPFLLSQAFAAGVAPERPARIVNILDWRAMRPGPDHFPYTISKAALAALTEGLAAALAPRVLVNGLALGAILPPSDGGDEAAALRNVPLRRWSRPEELAQALVFLLSGPEYMTGEILYLDGGRHLL